MSALGIRDEVRIYLHVLSPSVICCPLNSVRPCHSALPFYNFIETFFNPHEGSTPLLPWKAHIYRPTLLCSQFQGLLGSQKSVGSMDHMSRKPPMHTSVVLRSWSWTHQPRQASISSAQHCRSKWKEVQRETGLNCGTGHIRTQGTGKT